MALSKLTADFITTTAGSTNKTTGDINVSAASFYIGDGLDIPATNGILHINYDSDCALSATGGPETIKYGTYTTATGVVATCTRGVNGTTGIIHPANAPVSIGISVEHLNEFDRKSALDTTIIGDNDTRATRFVAIDPTQVFTENPVAGYKDVMVSAYVSSTAYAITGRAIARSTNYDDGLSMRMKGTTGIAYCTGVLNNNVYNSGGFTVGLDEDMNFEIYIDNDRVDSIIISIDGYFEYVD